MEKQKLNLKYNTFYNKINLNINRPFKDIKFTNNQNYALLNKDKNLHNKYLFKIKDSNKFQNKTLFERTSISNKLNENIFIKEKKIIDLKNDINKENQIHENKFQFNKNKKIRCFSQEKIKIDSINKNLKNNEEEEDDDINNKDIKSFFDNINKEFEDIGKIIKINLAIDEERKYVFDKNEFVLLKIIENELKEKYSLKIKEFIYNNKKLHVYKSLKENKLKNNCTIKISLE